MATHPRISPAAPTPDEVLANVASLLRLPRVMLIAETAKFSIDRVRGRRF